MLTIFTYVWSHFKFNVKRSKTVLRIEWLFLPDVITNSYHVYSPKQVDQIACRNCQSMLPHELQSPFWNNLKRCKMKKKRIKQLELSCWVTTRMDSEWFIWRLGENWIFWNFLWGCSIKLQIHEKNDLIRLSMSVVYQKSHKPSLLFS